MVTKKTAGGKPAAKLNDGDTSVAPVTPKPLIASAEVRALNTIIAQNMEILKHLEFQTLMTRAEALWTIDKPAARLLKTEAAALFA